MIAIVDYGLGNLYSLNCSLDAIGAEHVITSDSNVIKAADKLILPGVGAFRDAIDLLNTSGLGAVVVERAHAGIPLLGICLGMQLLFERSYEYGEYEGLGLLDGEICPIEPNKVAPLKVPHIGWNNLDFQRDSILTERINGGDYVYYVHSYYAKGAGEALIASSEYGITIPGVVQRANVMGTQFHPEKSGEVGLRILASFCEVTA